MIEQPASSRLPWYPYFEGLVAKVKTWRVGWWSRHYGSLSPTFKRIKVIQVFLFKSFVSGVFF